MYRFCVLSVFIFVMFLSAGQLFAQADIWIQGCPGDTGSEPNSACPNAPWTSVDIWNRLNADDDYDPYPFTDANGPSWNPVHQNPQHRPFNLSSPNYLYVRVRNRGTQPTTGTERLRVYWTKARAGGGWPNAWVDNMQDLCTPGTDQLYGIEITKTRKNAAAATQAERDAFIQALLGLNDVDYASGVSYWDMLDLLHQGSLGAPEHGNAAFLPWHRELVNRFELGLREVNPLVRLLYWDAYEDPNPFQANNGNFNFFTPQFLGAASGSIGAPFDGDLFGGGGPYRSCGNLDTCWLNPVANVRRWVGAAGMFPSDSFWSIPNRPYTMPAGANCSLWLVNANNDEWGSNCGLMDPIDYQVHNFIVEGSGLVGPHNYLHAFLGGQTGANLLNTETAVEDPAFFVGVHTQVDMFWAMWQRDKLQLTSSVQQQIERIDPATAYGSVGSDPKIMGTMSPWDGAAANGSPTSVGPWNTQSIAKTPRAASVLYPPLYEGYGPADSVFLTVPQLAAGESVIIEIPWYPPNPDNFDNPALQAERACEEFRHICLLARIEETDTAPFGMTVPEGSWIGGNAIQNNNVAWRNMTVEDFPGTSGIIHRLIISNPTDRSGSFQFGFLPENLLRLDDGATNIFAFGHAELELGEELFNRWVEGGRVGLGGALTQGRRGDANCDGEITVLDATVIRNHVSNVNRELCCPQAADVNGDGRISVNDIVAINNLILAGRVGEPVDCGPGGVAVRTGVTVNPDKDFTLNFDCPGDPGPDLGLGEWVDVEPECILRWPPASWPNIGLDLDPMEEQVVGISFHLDDDYLTRGGRQARATLAARPIEYSFIAATGGPEGQVIGGNTYIADLRKISLIPEASDWQYISLPEAPEGWANPGFDVSQWRTTNFRNRLEHGPGLHDSVTCLVGGTMCSARSSNDPIFFLHRFNLAEGDINVIQNLWLRLKVDDGADIYLNGERVHHSELRPVTGLAERTFTPVDISEHRNLLRAGENVVAVAVYKHPRGNDHIMFDFCLAGNQLSPDEPTVIAIHEPADGAYFELGDAISISAEAIDPDGENPSINYQVNGQPIRLVAGQRPSFTPAAPGVYKLRVGCSNNPATHAVTINVIDNIRPETNLSLPGGMMYDEGERVIVRAAVEDADRAGSRVVFKATRTSTFFGVEILLGEELLGRLAPSPGLFERELPDLDPSVGLQVIRDDEAPFEVAFDNLGVGEWMIQAITQDGRGAIKRSAGMVHAHVHEMAAPQEPHFIRGDSNGDSAIDISDGVNTLGFLFLGADEDPPCLAAADANGDGQVNISDATYTLVFLFAGGGAHPEPTECGASDAPGDEAIGCAQSTCN